VYFISLLRNSTIFTAFFAFLASDCSKCTEVRVCDDDRLTWWAMVCFHRQTIYRWLDDWTFQEYLPGLAAWLSELTFYVNPTTKFLLHESVRPALGESVSAGTSVQWSNILLDARMQKVIFGEPPCEKN
jgi:hypothetical protein